MEGLKNKYIISKADGTPVDPRAKYFVLRYDRHMKDKKFLSACRRALSCFCGQLLRIKGFELLSKELHDSIAYEVIEQHCSE